MCFLTAKHVVNNFISFLYHIFCNIYTECAMLVFMLFFFMIVLNISGEFETPKGMQLTEKKISLLIIYNQST